VPSRLTRSGDSTAPWYAVRGGRLLDPLADGVAVRTISARYMTGPVANGVVLALAFVSPWISLAGHVALAALCLIPERRPRAAWAGA